MRNGGKGEDRGETLYLTIRSSLVILGEPLYTHIPTWMQWEKKSLSLEMILTRVVINV